ncbi:MAG TPA: hypothetical protein VMB50_12760 [Myxococcales bacterium]|nr:hypothetical protein [Myxococcales bacterium]
MKTMDLVEQFLRNEQRAASFCREEPVRFAGGSEVNALVQQGREARELREHARDLRLGVRKLAGPEEIAEEMRRRSDYLRSRPMKRGLEKREREVLAALDEIEALARALSVQKALGAVPAAQVASETEKLSLAVFAVRGHFHDLLDSIDDPVPSRARLAPRAAREQELRLIEEFLERKRGKEVKR